MKLSLLYVIYAFVWHIGLHYHTSRYRPTIKCIEVLQKYDTTKCFMRPFDQWRHYITCENNDY